MPNAETDARLILRYRERRATQAAARLLQRRGGTMSYLKLIKLLYLSDRTALIRFGRPITYDRYVSMPHGPVLSRTYDLMVGEDDPIIPSYWREFIAPPANYEVRLERPAPDVDLSDAEVEILDEIFDEYGAMSRWQIRDLTHTLPEWNDPAGSSASIEIGDILRAGKMDEADIDAIIAELRDQAAFDKLSL